MNGHDKDAPVEGSRASKWPPELQSVIEGHGIDLFEFVMNNEAGVQLAAGLVRLAGNSQAAIPLQQFVAIFNFMSNGLGQAMRWTPQQYMACKQAIDLIGALSAAEPGKTKGGIILLNS